MKQLLNTIIATVFLLVFTTSYGQTRSSLKAQAQKVIAHLKKQRDYPNGGQDTLMDLNGDGYKDILIEFYYPLGTGLKNGIAVYLYNNRKKKFESCEQLNHLTNPTFYFNKKIIVGYYVSVGSGDATKLKWHGLRVDTLEHIHININDKGNDLRFTITSLNYLTKKKTTKTAKMVQLPKEYRYMDYEPIIKTSSR